TQHFQQQDRYAEGLMRGGLRAAALQSHGFSRLELDRAALDAGQIAIAAAAGIFPDGTPFAIPEDMPAPPAAPVRGENSAGLVLLAVPSEQAGAATIDPAHAEAGGARYRGRILAVRDCVRGGADPEDVEVATLAAHILSPADDPAGYSTLAIA